ncbi:MAG: hypothetical protein NUW37_20155 [Planctomycetes bacterium]|nr:hypothetical protein [Planctomycetota bacterium]
MKSRRILLPLIFALFSCGTFGSSGDSELEALEEIKRRDEWQQTSKILEEFHVDYGDNALIYTSDSLYFAPRLSPATVTIYESRTEYVDRIIEKSMANQAHGLIVSPFVLTGDPMNPVSVTTGTAGALPAGGFEKMKFDLVLIEGRFAELTFPANVLYFWHSLLADGGRIFVIDWNEQPSMLSGGVVVGPQERKQNIENAILLAAKKAGLACLPCLDFLEHQFAFELVPLDFDRFSVE